MKFNSFQLSKMEIVTFCHTTRIRLQCTEVLQHSGLYSAVYNSANFLIILLCSCELSSFQTNIDFFSTVLLTDCLPEKEA